MTTMSKAHMIDKFNREHNSSLYDYLAYYQGVRLDVDNPAHSVELVDIELDHLVLNYVKDGSSKTTTVQLRPPLQSYDQVRTRLLKMAYETADAFDVSPYSIRSYKKPGILGCTTTICTLLTLIFSFSPPYFSKIFSRKAPFMEYVIRTKIRKILLFLVLCHTSEYIMYVRPLLRKHRVFGWVRLQWAISTLLEGFPSCMRISRESYKLDQRRRKFERDSRSS